MTRFLPKPHMVFNIFAQVLCLKNKISPECFLEGLFTFIQPPFKHIQFEEQDAAQTRAKKQRKKKSLNN